MRSPMFSVIIPLFNRAHSINKAITSILTQTYSDFEIIIIDDASTDNSDQIIADIKDDRISYYRNDINQERCNSRNKGIELAKGEYICFLDSDDYHLPNHLQTIFNGIEKNNFLKAFYFVNSWNETEEGLRTERECPDFEKYNPYSYFLHYTVNPQRWAVHRSIFEIVKFDPEVVICEDMDTSLRIVKAGFSVFHLKKRTTIYVAAKDSFTHGDPLKWEKELFYLKRILKKTELKNELPTNHKNRLLSMCYYHLAKISFEKKQKVITLKYAVKSFFLYPKGYNGKTGKSTIVIILYSLPLLGLLMRIRKKYNS